VDLSDGSRQDETLVAAGEDDRMEAMRALGHLAFVRDEDAVDGRQVGCLLRIAMCLGRTRGSDGTSGVGWRDEHLPVIYDSDR
jgi:hypothetical protein